MENSISFTGQNYGIFALGRKILRDNPSAKIAFYFKVKPGNESEIELYQKNFESVIIQSRLGRIGIFCDRENIVAQDFCRDFSDFSNYNPKDKRALPAPTIKTFNTQLLLNFANEGLADSVEFRRLARKYIRQAKHAQIDTLFFPETIFGEAKTKKILQHLAGSQMRVITVDDLLETETSSETGKRDIKIYYQDEDLPFLKKRAEQILQTKLSEADFIKQDL